MGRNDKKDKMTNDQKYFDSEKFRKTVADLSRKAKLRNSFTLRPMQGGRNNRIFFVVYDNGTKILLKSYFQHPLDKRNRLKTEYDFMNYAWNNKIRCLPKPIAADFNNNLGIYEFIEGQKLSFSEINKKKLKQALDFFIEINKHKNTLEAKNLPIASEACFSIKEHLNNVENRINKLKNIKNNSEIDYKALSFVQNDLSKAWQEALLHARECINSYELDHDKYILEKDRCISPSDFGFHNALLNNDNKLIFIDFEYSGWDDPAKMVCDFFCQPEVPVQRKYFDYFAETVVVDTSYPKNFRNRIKVLLPVYKIKWCCILLNEFLNAGSDRRNFAYGKSDLNQRKINQLGKTKEYLNAFNFKI